ncbi:MAG: hypothetical protein JWP95_131 [Actinotalea sp.]|nr:hypothetical protein [Actinotalea sp.]
MTLVHDPARVPSGRRVRTLTSQIQGAREGRGLGAVVQELWYAAVTIGLCVAFVAGVATTLQGTVRDAAPAGAVTGEVPAALLVLALAGAVLSLAGRMGPVGVGSGGGTWWLPMPVDRRGLLRPAVLLWPAVALAAGAVLAPLVATAFGAPVSPLHVLRWAAVGGSLCAAAAGTAAIAQSAPGNARRHRVDLTVLVGDVLLLGAILAVAVLALRADAPSPWSLSTLGWVTAPLMLAAGLLTVLAERRIGLLDGARLRSKGSVGDRARVAVLSLDLRELSRALTVESGPARRRSWPLRPGGARRAVALADVLLLIRSPRLLLQIGTIVLLAVATTRLPVLGEGLPLHVVLVLTGFWTANAAAAGGRQAEMAPVLDRLLPLSARQVRVARGTVPLLASSLWSVAVLGLVGVRSGNPLWSAVVVPWALVLAAAAVRSAYRPQPNWARTPVATAMGSAPPTAGLSKGVDVVLVGTLPTAVALYVGALTPTLVVGQWVVAALVLVLLVGMSGRKPG